MEEIKGVCDEIHSNDGKTMSVGRKKGSLARNPQNVCVRVCIYTHTHTHMVLVTYVNFITSLSCKDNTC